MALRDLYELVVKVQGASEAKAELASTGAVAEESGSKASGAIAGIGSSLQAAGPYIAAAGIAVGIAAKEFGKFTDLAAEVLKFQRVTGDTAETSSKMIEVFHDYGVEADQAATLMGKFEKVIGTTPEKLKALGVEIARTKDGNVDVQRTFENTAAVFARTTDETERARLGAELFGKSWQQVIPLLQQGADGLATSFGNVSKSKILDDKTSKSAEEFRLSVDDLHDSLDGLQVQIGRAMLPSLRDFVDEVKALNDVADPLIAHIGGIGGAVGAVAGGIERAAEGPLALLTMWHRTNVDNAKKHAEALASLAVQARVSTGNIQDFADAQSAAADSYAAAQAAGMAYANMLEQAGSAVVNEANAQQEAAAATKAHDAELVAVNNSLIAYLSTTDKMIATEIGAKEATLKLEDAWQKDKNAVDAVTRAHAANKVSTNANEEAYLALSKQAIDTAKAQGEAAAKGGTQTEIAHAQLLALDAMAKKYPELSKYVLDYAAALALIPTSVTTDVSLQGHVVGLAVGQSAGRGVVGMRAHGGPVSAGEAYTVGENGPEVLQMGSVGGNIRPGGGSGGSNYTINVNVGAGGSPAATGQAIVDAIKAYERNNTSAWRK
jgi:hypothetical protein